MILLSEMGSMGPMVNILREHVGVGILKSEGNPYLLKKCAIFT